MGRQKGRVLDMDKAEAVLECIATRRSVRKFKPDAVPAALVEKVIAAGTMAATGMNRQAPIIVAVTKKEVRDRIAEVNGKILGVKHDPFYGAPVILIVLANKQFPTYLYDGSLVLGNLMLAAHALGLGSIWIHRAKEEFEMPEGKEFLKSLGIEGDYEGIGHCAIGYTDGPEPASHPRKANWVYHVD